MEGFQKGFLAKAYSSKEKGDSSKKNQDVSDKIKPLNVIKKAADAQTKPSQDKALRSEGNSSPLFSKGFLLDKKRKEAQKDIPVQNPASSSKKEVTETPKPTVEDKAPQSDVGSSSDSSKIGEILEKFNYIGGNTDLANAKVILLGESHISQHDKDIVNFINTHAEEGDIVLVEGVQAGQEVDRVRWAWKSAIALGTLDKDEVKQAREKDELDTAISRWVQEDKIILFKENIKVYGWDDMEAHRLSSRLKAQGIFKLDEGNSEEAENLANEQFNKRNEKLLDSITKMSEKSSDKRIFVVAGRRHFTKSKVQESLGDKKYITMTPTYNVAKNDLDLAMQIEIRKAKESFEQLKHLLEILEYYKK